MVRARVLLSWSPPAKQGLHHGCPGLLRGELQAAEPSLHPGPSCLRPSHPRALSLLQPTAMAGWHGHPAPCRQSRLPP